MLPDPRDTDPLRVEPTHPVIRCSRCGDALPFGRIGRCDDCIGRAGSPIGCLVLAIAFLVVAFIAAAVLAAPWSAPEPTALLDVSQGASAPGPTGGPRISPPATRSSAQDAPGALARERAPAQPTGRSAATGSPAGAGGIPRTAPDRFRGLATWYCLSGSSACTRGFDQNDLVAAIDSDLGFAKGDPIRVRYGDRSVVVTVVDVCRCPGDRLVDLTSGAFARLADLDVGVIPVTIEAAGPNATLPATETAP